ncbi:MAG TPA: OmpA family protein [Pseudorhizobium sp.]|nr:OmpA family protein [Pseudorhizobium sp.]
MSTKFRLFASVAAPLVSLPLMVQPAAAVPPKAIFQSAGAGDIIRVQEQLILPEDSAPQAEEEQEQEEAPAEEAPAEEPAVEEEAPEAAPEAQQEAPAEVQAEEPAPEPEAEPEPEPEQAEEPAAAEEAEEPAVEEAPAEEAPAEEVPAEEAPASQAEPEAVPQEEAPAEAQEDAAEEAPATSEQPAENDATSGEQPAPTEETSPTRDDAAPAEDPTDQSGEAPTSGEATDAPAAADGEASPADAGEAAPAEGTTDAPATDGANQDAATGQAAPAGEPAIATTPEQVERARAIAQDPTAAEEGETAVLPVENGAAILDSQKESAPAATTDGSAVATAPAQAEAPAAPPTSDAEAQAPLQEGGTVELRAATEVQGERIDGRPEFRRLEGWDYRDSGRRDGDRDRRRDRADRRDRDDDDDTRVIISFGDRSYVRGDDSRRFYRDGGEVYYERLPGDRYREVVERPGGVEVVTIRNSYGVVVQRSRIVDGEEYVLYYAPDLYEDEEYVWRDPARDLPPMRLTVPLDEYIIDTSSDPDRDYYEFLELPPVERVERVYSIDEVKYSARIRDKARRIDLDTIKFATGSAEIPMNQAPSLRKVAEAMKKVLDENPAETFLIEGHTDAVGSDESNLVLSDERASSVAVVLTDAFGIPPENLTTQGYGERYLKIRTEGPEQENRRVTIRRITPLVKPVASNQ